MRDSARRVFCNVRHTSVATDMSVSDKRTKLVNQGGTADKILFVLDSNTVEDFFCSTRRICGRFVCFYLPSDGVIYLQLKN